MAALSQVNDRCEILSQIQIHVPMCGFDDKYWLTNVLENDELSTYKTENQMIHYICKCVCMHVCICVCKFKQYLSGRSAVL